MTPMIAALRSRAQRRLLAATVLAAATALGSPSLPAAAGIPAGTFTEVEARTPISGLRGTWRFNAFASDGGSGPGTMVLGIAKRNQAKTAWADEAWRTAGGAVTCTPKLGSCAIDDQDELGTFGGMELAFTATGPLRTSKIRCTGSDVAYGTRKHRTGVLTGTVRLRTGSSTIGTIRNGSGAHRVRSTIPATAGRTTFDPDVTCPATPASCSAAAYLTTTGYFIGALRDLPTGPGRITLNRRLDTADPGVSRGQSVSVRGPGGSLLALETKQTLAGASLDLSKAAPFVSGSVTYAGGSLSATTFLGCDAKETGGTVTYDLVLRMPGRSKTTLNDTVTGELFRILPS